MNTLSPSPSLACSCDEALALVQERLALAHLRVAQTFDLQTARVGLEDCPCPHHGTSACDCQMVVLLVYGEAAEPAALILHGNDGQTWLSLVNTPAQHVDPSIRASIEEALQVNLRAQGL